MATATRSKKSGTNGSAGGESPVAPAIMNVELLTFHVVGVSPLLQNNPTEFIGTSEGGGLSAKKSYDDKKEAELRVYKDDDGNFVHPTKAFIKAMIRAVTGKKFGKVTATSAIRGAVFEIEQHSIILGANGKPAKKYAIDRQPVVIGTARVLRCRPRWDDWQMQVTLEVDTALLAEEQVRDALTLAGRVCGVGDYRPEKGGRFGRFVVQ